MSNCPKCSQPDLIWEKTKNGKNWLKDQNGNWHTCNVEKKPELGEPLPTTNQEKTKNLRESGGNLQLQKDGSLLSANYRECELCPTDNGRNLILKENWAIHRQTIHPLGKENFRCLSQ